MKACFEGRLDLGFTLMAVTEDKFTYHPKRQGMDVLTIPVFPPEALDPNWVEDAMGDEPIYVLFYRGLGSDMAMYGPFGSESDAEEFGEDRRDSDEEWECFDVQGEST